MLTHIQTYHKVDVVIALLCKLPDHDGLVLCRQSARLELKHKVVELNNSLFPLVVYEEEVLTCFEFRAQCFKVHLVDEVAHRWLQAHDALGQSACESKDIVFYWSCFIVLT